ncbi:MAG: flippase [Ignavibacteriales bacterium]|nr:flippase [Ignavibacteriales bacterium]
MTRMFSNMLLFIGIARFYGPEGFGQFTIAHTYLTLFYIVADFGFDLLLTTEVARSRDRSVEFVRRFLPIKMIFALGSIAVMSIIAIVSHFSEATKTLMFFLSISIVGNALTSFFFSLFKGHEQLYEETRTTFFQNLFLLCSIAILGLLHVQLIYIAVAFVLSRMLGVFLIFPRLRKIVVLDSIKMTFSGWQSTFKKGLPFGIHLLFGTLFFQLDTLLLAYWLGDRAVGQYQAVMKLIVLILVVPEVLINALLPVLVRLHSEDKVRWLQMNKLLEKTLLFIGFPFAIILFVYADQIITIVYGSNGYSESIPVMRIFALILLVRYSVETFALMLTTSHRQTERMTIVIGVTVLNFILNAYAIPQFGIVGAAIVSLITNLTAGTLYLFIAKKGNFEMGRLIDFRMVILFILTLLISLGLWYNARGVFSIGIIFIFLVYILFYYFIGYAREEKTSIYDFQGLWKRI